MDAAIAFYEKHFGMKLFSRRDMPESNAEICFVGYDQGGMRLELTHWRAWGPDDYVDGTTFDHIAIIVDEDLGPLLDRLRVNGVRIAKEVRKLASGSSIAFVHDLDGTWIELIQKGG